MKILKNKFSDEKQEKNVKKAHENIKLNSSFSTHPTRERNILQTFEKRKNIGDKKLSVEHILFSKWFDIFSMDDIKTNTLIDCLCTSFCIHVLPHIIVSDNGPSFASSEFKSKN